MRRVLIFIGICTVITFGLPVAAIITSLWPKSESFFDDCLVRMSMWLL